MKTEMLNKQKIFHARLASNKKQNENITGCTENHIFAFFLPMVIVGVFYVKNFSPITKLQNIPIRIKSTYLSIDL